MRPRLFAPEVVQTSAMDCGPAALKSLLEGFGLYASYGRLREACQTDIDGTSVDTIEAVAVQLGLDAEQVMIPPDHLLVPEARALPALVVVLEPNGNTHFVVAWRRHGSLVQIMDPRRGRRWVSCEELLGDLYRHTTIVPAEGWLEYASSPSFLEPLDRRVGDCGVARAARRAHLERARASSGWRALARLDAAARMLGAIVRGGGVRRGRDAEELLAKLVGSGVDIPDRFWSVRSAPAGDDGGEQVTMTGAVLVTVRGRRKANARQGGDEPLSPDLVAALAAAPARPGRELWRLLRADGLLAPGVVASATIVAAGGVVVEAIVLRALLDVGRDLGVGSQRLGALAAVVLFALALLLVELPIAAGLFRLGRHLEARLRVAVLEKIPRIGDRYFGSRLTSDMAERSHAVQSLRQLPHLGGQLFGAALQIVLTTAAILWLAPSSAPLAVTAALLAIAAPLLSQPLLSERDLRARTHLGALSRFYFDALLGLVCIRAHGADLAVRREQEGLLVDWASASLRLQRTVVLTEGVQAASAFGLAAWLVVGQVSSSAGPNASALLLAYWALALPSLGQKLAVAARQVPVLRNVTLRLLEPLQAPEERPRAPEPHPAGADHPAGASAPTAPSRGVSIELTGVRVRSAGHVVLDGIDVSIPAGGHVAIVGVSGAGKSTLVGLLLGWTKATDGAVAVDGEPLSDDGVSRLRAATAWVDPGVTIWNGRFLDNLLYGARPGSSPSVGRVVEAADLRSVLERLPDGLQTSLGEGGALVSGGEGQRVRLGRAMLRPAVRLAILDEPFRGLDRERRGELLARARRAWSSATLLCITHDVGQTVGFERVLVMEGGRLVEDGVPSELAARSGSRYRELLEAEEAVRAELWSSERWRRVRVEGGRLVEPPRLLERRERPEKEVVA